MVLGLLHTANRMPGGAQSEVLGGEYPLAGDGRDRELDDRDALRVVALADERSDERLRVAFRPWTCQVVEALAAIEHHAT